MSKWFNQYIIGNGSLNRKPQRYKDLGDYSIETLVRELIQNSIDAKLPSEKNVKLKLTIKELEEKELKNILEFVGKDQINLFKESYDEAVQDVKVKMTAGHEVLTKRHKKEYALIIEEFNTIGLTGSVLGVEDKSNFDSLMRKTDNNEAKQEIEISGGTWGKGSSIFTFTSKLWMWFGYSCLSKGWEDKEAKITHSRRFMGRCMIAPFFKKEEKLSYIGDGWYSENKYGNEPYPFVNDTADNLAEKLGMRKRNGDFGTTFYIPFFNPYLDSDDIEAILNEFKLKILQNWFVPIYNELLEVSLIAGSTQVFLDKALVIQTPELKFKNEILEWYNSGMPKKKNFHFEEIEVEMPALQKGYLNEKNKFAAKKQTAKIDLVLRILDEDEEYLDRWSTGNKVFLTRNRGMLVSYFEPFKSDEVRFESILFSGVLSKSETDEAKKKHLDLFLAYSENPAHNKWCDSSRDYNICFLDRFSGKSPKPETYVGRIFNAISNSLKKFVVKEKKSNTSKDICSIFKKLTKLKSSGTDSNGKTDFFMRTPDQVSNPTIDNLGRYLYTYRFISNMEDEDLNLSFKPYIVSLEGEKDSDFENLDIPEFSNIELLDSHGDIIEVGHQPSITLAPGEEKIISIRTCPILGKKVFKNVQPLIKTRAHKILLNE